MKKEVGSGSERLRESRREIEGERRSGDDPETL